MDIKTPYELKEVRGGETVEEAVVFHNKTMEEERLPVDAVILSLGFNPDLSLVEKWDLQLEDGGIAVNSRMETSRPGIYAAGDIVLPRQSEAHRVRLRRGCNRRQQRRHLHQPQGQAVPGPQHEPEVDLPLQPDPGSPAAAARRTTSHPPRPARSLTIDAEVLSSVNALLQRGGFSLCPTCW